MREAVKEVQLRIIDLALKHKVGHLSSALTAAPLIYEAYQNMTSEEDKFVLSQGHAGLALYCVLEQFKKIDAEAYLEKYHIHPHREPGNYIEVSTGSLGHGLPIAVGLAMANRNRNVFCVISDGECGEGSIWEAMSLIEKFDIRNLWTYVNANGTSAFGHIDTKRLEEKLRVFNKHHMWFRHTENPPMLWGIRGHYKILDEATHRELREFIIQQ